MMKIEQQNIIQLYQLESHKIYLAHRIIDSFPAAHIIMKINSVLSNTRGQRPRSLKTDINFRIFILLYEIIRNDA